MDFYSVAFVYFLVAVTAMVQVYEFWEDRWPSSSPFLIAMVAGSLWPLTLLGIVLTRIIKH